MGLLKSVRLSFLAWSAILALLWMQTSDAFLNLADSGYTNYSKVGMGWSLRLMHSTVLIVFINFSSLV